MPQDYARHVTCASGGSREADRSLTAATGLLLVHNMNDNRSQRETTTLPRAAAPALSGVLAQFPVVVVIGARQTGKSTLVQTLPALAGRPYLTLDDPELRDQARGWTSGPRPRAHHAGGAGAVV
jgi:hypothetical protein